MYKSYSINDNAWHRLLVSLLAQLLSHRFSCLSRWSTILPLLYRLNYPFRSIADSRSLPSIIFVNLS